jgi:hypothetical protein
MNIEEIIPRNDKWKINKGIVYVKYLAWVPIIDTRKGYIEIFFDIKLMKYLLKLIPKIKTEFYLISPILSDPSIARLSDEDIHKVNVKNYLSNYANPGFFSGFQKIEFDLITNLILYCKKFDIMLLIKEAYDEVNVEVQRKNFDWYQNKEFYNLPQEIREEFSSLYRQIKLAELLN